MDRFGSSRLRIVWTSVSLLLAGLCLGAIQGFDAGGSRMMIFGTSVPIGADVRGSTLEILCRFIYTMVPAIMVFGGFLPILDWMSSSAKTERLKGLLLGSLLAFLHGIFMSQVALLPVIAATFKFFGSPFGASLIPQEGSWGRILQADLNGLVLGLQLLFWSGAVGLVLKSSRGLAILGAYSLAVIGKVLAWLGEWGPDLELPKWVVKSSVAAGRVLPFEALPGDPLAWASLPVSLGAPLALSALLLLLPGKAAARKIKT